MVIEVNDISKLYKNNRGASDINFSIDEGEIFGLLGPNGSGKTTIMKILTSLTRQQKGTVKIFGYDTIEQTSKALENVGSLIEMPSSISYLSAYDNLKVIKNFYKESMDINEVLEMVGLLKFKKEKVSKFSLGMKQRMGIALAIIGKPKVLVLDEPTNGLDIEGTVEIRNLIVDMAKQKNTTIIISSHLSSELQLMCTKVGVMEQSKLLKIENMNYVSENYSSLENYYLDIVTNSR